MLGAAIFFYMLCAVNRYASRYRFFFEFFSQNFTLILLFFQFFRLSVCLWQLSAGTVLCALIKQSLAGHSVLYSLSFLQYLLIFSVKEGQFSALQPCLGQAFAASGQAFIGQFDSPCLLPQLVPSLRNPSDFTSEFFFWCHCLPFFTSG